MVLDNADDLDTFFAKTIPIGPDCQPTKPLVDYVPLSSRGLMLITTRDGKMSRRLGGRDTPILVEAMLPSEAQDLLRSRSERSGSDNDENSRILVDELAYIPLAITQAAAFISENEISLAEYLNILHTGDSDLQDLLDEDLRDLRRDPESHNSVIRTWKISFDLISKQNPRAAEMLSLMAVLDRQGIPESLLQNDTDRKTEFVTARGILQRFSLISTENGGSKYELHRLVQLATRKWLEIQGTKEKWQVKALLVLLNIFPDVSNIFPKDIFENWTTCASLLPHIQTVTEYENIKKACPGQFAHLLCHAACCDLWQGRDDDAHMKALAAYEMQKEFPNPEYNSSLPCVLTLLCVYRDQGWRDEAEKFTVQVMEAFQRPDKENSLSEEDSPMQACMTTLSSIYLWQKRWDKAEEVQLRLLDIRKRLHTEEHADTLLAMGDLASTYWNQERRDKALELQERVVEIQTRLFEEHPDTLTNMANLALMHGNQNRWDKSIDLIQVVIKLRTKILGADHPDTLEAIKYLGEWELVRKVFGPSIGWESDEGASILASIASGDLSL